ncbi:MAG: nucleotidyltransferase [Lachnospiraceae bacterium]|nr:nucleotidyltransferase [Lachnospiraceae bacterium]
MKVAGIVAEYNPFHNGHAYHMQKVKELTGADYLVVVMSGNFTQRGVPALIDKYTRTKMALDAGADLVLELPLYYAAGSAEYFASGAVALLDKLGVVDTLCFGSECGDIKTLTEIAILLSKEDEAFSNAIKSKMKQGLTYPRARMQVIEETLPDSFMHVDAMSYPNNILGIEYIKAIIQRDSKILPQTTRRMGAGYHDRMVTEVMSSALSIRESLKSADSLDMIKSSVPDYVYKMMKQDFHKTFPIFHEDISSLLKYKLLLDAPKGFTEYVDISQDFSDKIVKNLRNYESYSQFCDLLKTKDITYARVSRCLLHILLNLRKDALQHYVDKDYIFYGRILGLRKSSNELTSAIKKVSKIPMISKLADAREFLTSTGMEMLECDIQASHIYDSLVTEKFGNKPMSEFSREIVIVE